MSNENQGAIELADEELDMVAGGFIFSFSVASFEQSDRLFIQNTQSGRNGNSTNSLIATRDIRSFAIQALIVDATPEQLGQIL
ncbi:CTB family bacteriocin [Calothrix sp. NIES-2098]|uniref:CTB family bacteriocin n=1 Tax=Calothrix sp. NIES-2098 TaxID=1954171 RepID=UPI000B61D8D1|nr:hypothetical protein NIES2098_23120 [Calothrix sp. NIES-2098]